MVQPYQQRVQSRGARQQGLSVQASPQAFGSQIGDAAQSVAEGIGSMTEARVAREELNASNDARKALNEFMEADRHLRLNPEDGYLTQTGSNAIGQRESYNEALRRSREAIGRNLSPAARRQFDERADTIVNRSMESFIGHEADQLRSYTIEQGNALVQGFVDEALTSFDNPQLFEENLAEAIGEFNDMAALQGMSPAAAEEGRRDLTSGVVRAAAMRMAGSDNTNGAQRALDFIDANRERMTAEDHHELQEVIDPIRIEQEAGRYVERHIRAQHDYNREAAQFDDSRRLRRSENVIALSRDEYAHSLVKNVEAGHELGSPEALRATNQAADAELGPSSAQGPYQFVRGTWLANVQRAVDQGKLPPAYANMTNDQLLELRTTDQNVNDIVFSVFRQHNRDILERNGLDPADAVNEHFMHWLGEGAGLRALKADPNASIEQIIGSTAARQNNLRGKTVGQVKDWSAQRLGIEPTSMAPGASEIDLEGAYDEILQLPADVRGEAIRQLDTVLKAQERSNNLRREGAQRDAFERFERGEIEGPQDLSIDQRLQMGRGGVEAFQSFAQNRLQGVQHTDEGVFNNLMDMAAFEQQEFAELDLEYHRPNLTDSDYRQLSQLQRDTRGALLQGQQETEAMLGNLNSAQAFNRVAPIYRDLLEYDPTNPDSSGYDAEQVSNFRRSLQRRMQEFAVEHGREPGEADLQSMAYELLAPVTVSDTRDSGWFGGGEATVPLFDMQRVREPGADVMLPPSDYDDIPADKAEAIQLLIHNADMSPSDERRMVELLYDADRIASGPEQFRGLAPEVTIEDVLNDPGMAQSIERETVSRPLGSDGRTASREVFRFRPEGRQGRVIEMTEEELVQRYGRFLVELARSAYDDGTTPEEVDFGRQ